MIDETPAELAARLNTSRTCQPLPGDDDPIAVSIRRIDFEVARIRMECTLRIEAAEERAQTAEAEVTRLRLELANQGNRG